MASLINKRITLKATYNGYVYTATLRKNGEIYMNGYLYNSPTAAAKDIVQRSVNGWRFWKYNDLSGTWVSLNTLKK